MLQGFGWPHLLIILVVVIVLFGAKRLPDAARGVGKSLRIFKSEAKAMRDDEGKKDGENAENTAEPQQLPQATSQQSTNTTAQTAPVTPPTPVTPSTPANGQEQPQNNTQA